MLIHYQGNTSADNKNLSHETAAKVCETILQCGFCPIILDWDNRSPLPDNERIFNPHVDHELWKGLGTGDAETLLALIESSTLMIGIDSGPLHVAGAGTTPALGVWLKHHPLHYFALADHVTHLVPRRHSSLLRGNRDQGTAFFEEHYRHQTYSDVTSELCAMVERRLRGENESLFFTRGFWVRSDNVDQDLVVVSDIAEQDSYDVASLSMPHPVIVDVGAHIGCFAKTIHKRNPLAQIICVECCPENIAALKRNAGEYAEVVQAAMTYEQNVALKNAVYPNCVTTGGSIVAPRCDVERVIADGRLGRSPADASQYWADLRPVETVTLETLCDERDIQWIDVLKLDCEGSEFSILENCSILDRVGVIIGEFHGRERFMKLVERKLPDWSFRILKDGELGTFRLENPGFKRAMKASRPAPSPDQIRTSRSGLPRMLVAALRNDNSPVFDLLKIDNDVITAVYSHKDRGWLRGFARRQGEIWTVDSQGRIYTVDLLDDGILTEVSASNMAHEAHDLICIGGKLATAGPTNGVIAVFEPSSGSWTCKRPWMPSFVREATDPDSHDRHHLNSLAHDGEKFVLSMFTASPKPADVRWRDTDLRHGLVTRWDTDGFEEPIAREQYAPHSLLIHDGRLLWCESFEGRIHSADGWRSGNLGGFARGLVGMDEKLLVGLSKSRVAPNPTFDRCGVALLDGKGMEIAFVSLPEPYIEIYDLIRLYESDG